MPAPRPVLRGLRALFLGCVVAMAAAAPAAAVDTGCLPTAAPASPPPGLRFGIYPGGPAGSVYGAAAPLPEHPAKRAAALQGLRGDGPFVVHLYVGITGDPVRDAGTDVWLRGEIAGYRAAGMLVELVARYQPTGGDPAGNATRFAERMRHLVRTFGADPVLVGLQVGNEANIGGAPDASDGAYAGAVQALTAGVVAAGAEVRATGFRHVRVGFNWAYDERVSAGPDFFRALAHAGGPAFAAAVDWVGLDSYPGTWSPQLSLAPALPEAAAAAVVRSLDALRTCLMPLAGLGSGVPIHVSENGFPTGPGRSPELQLAVMQRMVHAVSEARGRFNVTDYRWFDLRDSLSGTTNFESEYGITHDDYSPKPAFWAYRDLVAALGPGAPAPPPVTEAVTTAEPPALAGPAPDVPLPTPARPATLAAARPAVRCSSSPVRLVLPAWRARGPVRVRVRSGGRTVRQLRGRTLPKALRVRLAPGRSRLSVQVTMRASGRTITRRAVRSFTVCARPTWRAG